MSDTAFAGTGVSPLSIQYDLTERLQRSKVNAGFMDGESFKLDDASINSYIADFPYSTAAANMYKQLKQELEDQKKLHDKNLAKINSRLDAQLNKYTAEKANIRAQIDSIKEPPASDEIHHPPMVITDAKAVAKAAKLKHEVNGEYVYTRLKLVENSKFQLAALVKLKDSYKEILDKTLVYLNPYNVRWEQRDAMRALVTEYNKCYGLMEELRLMEEERARWIAELKRMTQREHGFMYYWKKITFSSDHSYENDLDTFKREYKMLQKERKAQAKEDKTVQKEEEMMLKSSTKNGQ